MNIFNHNIHTYWMSELFHNQMPSLKCLKHLKEILKSVDYVVNLSKLFMINICLFKGYLGLNIEPVVDNVIYKI